MLEVQQAQRALLALQEPRGPLEQLVLPGLPEQQGSQEQPEQPVPA